MNRKERRLIARLHSFREWMLEMAMQEMANEHIGIIGELLNEKQELQDAAEFEARVAAKLSDLDFATGGEPCEQCPFCNEEYCTDVYKVKNQRECTSKWSRLKEARIAIEEGMDG